MVIFFDAGARRRRNLDKRKSANPFWRSLKQLLDCAQALFDSLGVIESIDADANGMILRQTVPLTDSQAAFIRRASELGTFTLSRRTPPTVGCHFSGGGRALGGFAIL
jgi:hypothetical protein